MQAFLPEEHSKRDKQRFDDGQGGELKAVMYMDKDLAELTGFADLVTESEQMEQDWFMVLVACLSGNNSISPTAEEAEQPLKMMVQTVQNGGDLSQYLAFDKQGELLRFG